MASRNRFCRQYLQNLNTLIFWFKYLQKVNAMPSDFRWKKKVLPLWQITFDPLKNGLKKYSSMEQNLFFFHQKSEGIAFTFCRYLYQNMRASIFCMYCPPIVFCPQIGKTKKNSKIEGNTMVFWDEVFSLSMPSVCPHVTTVYLAKGFYSIDIPDSDWRRHYC